MGRGSTGLVVRGHLSRPTFGHLVLQKTHHLFFVDGGKDSDYCKASFTMSELHSNFTKGKTLLLILIVSHNISFAIFIIELWNFCYTSSVSSGHLNFFPNYGIVNYSFRPFSLTSCLYKMMVRRLIWVPGFIPLTFWVPFCC